MDRGLDPHLQRIVNNATAAGNQEGRFGFAPEEYRSSEWSFRPGPRQPVQQMQDSTSFNDLGRASFDMPCQPPTTLSIGPSRLSLAPQSIYNQPNQREREPRTISNADNHFRFTQNLRQGMPISQTSPRQTLPQTKIIDQLANAMVMQRSMVQTKFEPESGNRSHGLHHSKLNKLQPQTQQLTPPFNLSGFAFSPSTHQASESSSPIVGQASSPTTRVSQRRASNRATAASEHLEFEDEDEGSIPTNWQTSQRQNIPPTGHPPPPTLALGHAPPMAHGIQLVSPHRLPDRFRQVFPYELFNAVQSKCFSLIYKTDDNVVISAPTGSGKTALLELAICKLAEGYASGQFKIVYQAPTKSLCSERMRDWQKKFAHLNLQCAELTGDTSHAEMAKVRTASIIVTTPEKWDSITRKWIDHHKLVQMVKLFLIDEVHILKDVRGATLEAVVSRMKTMGANVRFVALSATVPNSHDIALWLGKDHTNHHLPAHRESFGEDFRPVKLQKHVHGFDGMMNDYAFEKILDGKLPGLIQKYTHKKPIIVFCFTRKSCEATATMLAEWWTRQRVTDRAWQSPLQRTAVGSKELQSLVACGVAFHHAGLDAQDRHAVETAYLKGDISLICCTSTLAVGVNLPCHLVVLKGTVGFQDGLLTEYSDLEVMQMLGRAGRPQFDDSAVAVTMTRSDKADRYKKMISGQDILESTLHLNLIEHLNSEISLGSVKSLHAAKRWISGTFLCVRMRQNPGYYKMENISHDGDTDSRLESVCERDIKLLQEHKLVTDEERFQCTEYGDAMSRYMVKFDTMKLLLSIPYQAKTEQILQTICEAAEFKDLRMRPAERPFLREFNKSPFIKFPIKDNVSSTAHKIFLMIQIQLGGVEHPAEKEFTMIRRQFNTEKSIIFDRIQRLIRCVVDCKADDRDAVAARHALDLARSLSAEFWENSNLQLRQISGIGPAAVRKLVSNDVNSVEKLAGKDTASIERILAKNPPYGRKLLDSLSGFPRLSLISEITGKAPNRQGQNPKVNVRAIIKYLNLKIPVWMGKKPSLTLMAETMDGLLIHFWRGNIIKLEKGNFEVKFAVELSGPNEEIRCWVACDDIVGTVRSCFLKHDIPGSAFTRRALPKDISKEEHSSAIGLQRKTLNSPDEFGGDELDDDDLLAAVKTAEKAEIGYESDGFADIDDFDNVPATQLRNKTGREARVSDSVQMENGKWTCNHPCRGDQILKNGQQCKHKCCRDGLDKPAKPRKQLSGVKRQHDLVKEGDDESGDQQQVKKCCKARTGTRANGTNARALGTNPLAQERKKLAKDVSGPKLKLKKEAQSDFDDVEIIDLANELSPVPYPSLGPRDYRKLHSPHTSVQKDKEEKSIRLPKQKPTFSYTTDELPDLPFLRKSEKNDDSISDFDLDEDFPSPSELVRRSEDDLVPESDALETGVAIYQQALPSSSDHGDCLDGVGVIRLAKLVALKSSTPKPDLTFDNSVFDFAAFHDPSENEDRLINPLMSELLSGEGASSSPLTRQDPVATKRERSPSPEITDIKHRRVTKTDSPQPVPRLSSVPAWVNEFDSELIDGLKDFVDFVD